jgi:hypothetical protein
VATRAAPALAAHPEPAPAHLQRRAAGTAPVSDFYLAWHLPDVPPEHLRADRVLHEALAVDADPLHLAAAFGLSTQTAIDYAGLARALISRPVEDHPLDLGR